MCCILFVYFFFSLKLDHFAHIAAKQRSATEMQKSEHRPLLGAGYDSPGIPEKPARDWVCGFMYLQFQSIHD